VTAVRELVPDPDSHLVDPDRLDRVRAGYRERDLDGLLAFSPPNSFYLTGCYVGMYSRPVLGLVTDETSAFGGPAIETRTARRRAWTDRATLYEDADDPFAVLARAVPEGTDRLGVDLGRARPDWVEALDARTDATFVRADDLFASLRAEKTDWELAMMRRASDLAGAGITAFREAVESGVPELELADAVQDAFYDTYLAEHPEYDVGTANELGQYGFANALTGAHALEPHSLSASTRVADGDAVVGIALPSLQGYVCEEERTVLVGDVDPEIERAMATLVEVRREAMDMVEAGRATDEIDAVTSDRLADAGYESNVVHRTGHGEGVTIHEGPALNRREPGELRSGMVISVEPGLYFPDRGVALRHSDTLVVTDAGHERLTETPDGVLVAE
jgi:Xaa-Pro aminopeptidase